MQHADPQLNREYAATICEGLITSLCQLTAGMKRLDPEGRATSLGVAMFMGAFMGCISKMEDRQLLCDAAMGLSLGAHEGLTQWRR